jgi:Methylamine utilisation protein MauE
VIDEIIRFGIGLLFFAAGVSKMLRRHSVQLTVKRYRFLPAATVGPAALALGPAEIVVGSALVVSPWLPSAGLAWIGAAILLTLFSVAIASALARGLVIPCGCGILLGDHAVTPLILARNLTLLALLFLVR